MSAVPVILFTNYADALRPSTSRPRALHYLLRRRQSTGWRRKSRISFKLVEFSVSYFVR
jgi:hypothetical protein